MKDMRVVVSRHSHLFKHFHFGFFFDLQVRPIVGEKKNLNL